MWINAGHEVFQEARAKTTTLLEQAIAGYHEGNDVVYAMSHPDFTTGTAARPGGHNNNNNNSGGTGRDETSVIGGGGGGGMRAGRRGKENPTTTSSRRGGGPAGAAGGADSGSFGGGGGGTFEDSYINNVLGTMGDLQAEARHRGQGDLLRSSDGGVGVGGQQHQSSLAMDGGGGSGVVGRNGGDGLTEMGSAWDGSVGEVYGSSWENYRSGVAAADANAAARGSHRFGSSGGGGGGGSTAEEDERLRRGGARTSSPSKGRRRHDGGSGGGGGEDRDAGGIQGRSIMVGTVLDASHPAFERQNNLVYGFGQGSKVYPQPEEFPEVSE